MRKLCPSVWTAVLVLLLGGPKATSGSVSFLRRSVDSTTVEVRTPATETLAHYRGDPAYTYASASTNSSWWERFWAWVFEQLSAATAVPWASDLLTVLVPLIVTGLFLFAVRWLYRMRRTRPLDSRSDVPGGEALSPETMETEDFVARAERAEERGAYRRAVRFRYLALLQRLMREGLIDWTPDRANRALVRETQGHPVHDPFAHATEVFEAVWYGGVSVDGPTYEHLRDLLVGAREQDASTTSSPS